MIDWQQLITAFLGVGIGGTIVGIISQHYSNKSLVRYNLVSDSQFKTFNELWKSLTDLKIKANDLWGHANDIILLSFVNSLKDASDALDANSLLLNDADYNNLKNILNKFGEYQIGKTKLIDIDKGKIKTEIKMGNWNGSMMIFDERLNQVSQNESLKKEYEKLLEDLKKKFQERMGIR